MSPQTTETPKDNETQSPTLINISTDYGKYLAHPSPGDEVVISGISGKYPESNNVHEFAEHLFNKDDMVTDDTRRWEPSHPEVPQRTGKIPNIEKFDAGFFGISHKQTTSTDPMTRKLLEVALEAIYDAGLNPTDLEGTRTGVFIAICFVESEKQWYFTNKARHYNPVVGCKRSIMPHRLSYFLKLKGPSLVVDTACSSSLFALEHAFKAIRNGDCDRAIVGGCNLCTHPYVSLQFNRLGVLSNDGACKAFDKEGNGYARSETVSAILLEKAKDAKRSYYTLVHAKTNCDGFKSSGITFPSRESQAQLLKEFYLECNVDPKDLSFLEAHGTGTKVGDPEELMAIEDAFLGNRKEPLLLGSTKSNIGHTEPSSGLCSLTKVIIATETGFIPPNLHYKNPRSESKALVERRLEVVSDKMPFRDNRGLIGVNSFGFGGSNCHILLRRNPKIKINNGRPTDDLTRLVCASGRTEEAVATLLDDVCEKIDEEHIRLVQEIFRKSIKLHDFRGYVLLNKAGVVDQKISNFTGIKKEFYISFSEMNFEDIKTMGSHFMQVPAFAKTIQQVDEGLQSKTMNIQKLFEATVELSLQTQTLASAAIHFGLMKVLQLLEIHPAGFIGLYNTPLIGELICAACEDSLSIKDAMECCYYISATICKESARDNDRNELIEQLSKILKISKKQQKNNNKNVYPFSREYILSSLDNNSKTSKSVFTTRVLKDSLVLHLGGKNEVSQQFLKHCDVMNGSSSFEHFLQAIGRLYESGHYPQISKLYRPIEFPVSRGTPMIAPKIKWKHDRNWWVTIYSCSDQMDIEGNLANITTQHLNYKYLAGHVIDGRTLFPATGYLHLAWETICQVYGLILDESQIVIENCKFKRACPVPKTSERIELVTLVQRSTGQFEVEESGIPVMSGRIYFATDTTGELLPMQDGSDSYNNEGPVMSKKDIYKELKLRGYHYSGDFKAMESFDSRSQVAYLKWKDNWVAFMDNMLQAKIIQEDTRLLYVPTTIKRVFIDAKYHKECAAKYGDQPLPVRINKESNIIRSGGIEFRGLNASSIPRRKYLGTPVLEKYLFIPNEAALKLEESIRINTQITLENGTSLKVKVVEVGKSNKEEIFEPLSPLILKVLRDLPLVKPDITIFTKAQLEIDDDIKLEDRNLVTETDCTIIVGFNILQSVTELQVALGCLLPNGFILSREEPDANLTTITERDVSILTIHHTPDEKLILFRKLESKPSANSYTAIEVTNHSFNWLDDLQKALKTQDKSTIVAYSQNDSLSGILGLVNCIRREPGGISVKCVFVVDENAPKFDANLAFYRIQLEKNLAINVYKNGQWGSYRHLLLDDVSDITVEHFYVNSTVRGDLSSIKWLQGELSSNMKIEPGQSLVDVYCAALNFRDIMLASGRINVDVVSRDRRQQSCVIGLEVAGVTKDGRRVMACLTSGSLSTMILADDLLLWRIPDHWSLEEAATVPVVYLTCLYALIKRGNMKRGNTILVHSGTGGIGLAAITLALHIGCTIYTTVGTDEKRSFLKKHFPQLSDRNIANSRDTSFENHIKRETHGRGVDIVLNSLAEEKLLASVRCLAHGGRFLEIGKFDLGNDNRINLLLLEKEASFHGIMLDQLITASPRERAKISRILQEGVDSGAIKPLVRTVFKSNDIEQAFRFMTSGKHIGKIVVEVRKEEQNKVSKVPGMDLKKFTGLPRYYCHENDVVIICGGLGGFGLELADWLVLRGCRNLVLTSREGVKTGYQAYRKAIWKSYGCAVHISTQNITTRSGVENLLRDSSKMGKIKAIFNLAVVLKDALIDNQTEETFQIAFGPKVTATKYLDELSRKLCPDLNDFVVFSSVSCGRGNGGQTNYGMANSVMERICEKRQLEGYPALAIQWGAVGEVGLVAEMQENYIDMEIGGTLQQRITNCLEVLDQFLQHKDVAVVGSMVVAEKRYGSGGADNVVTAVANILGIKDLKSISFQATLAELGMDSMSAVEMKQTLEREFEVFLTPQDIKTMTFARLQEIQDQIDTDKEKGVKKERALGGMEMILRVFGDEDLDNITVVNLKTKSSSEYPEKALPKIFALPGIEGSSCTLNPLAANMEADILCLQFCSNVQKDTVEEMAVELLPHIEKNLIPGEPFNLLGYSFGAVVGLEMLKLLEAKGHIGNLVCIDGSPVYLKELSKMGSIDNDDMFQSTILVHMMAADIDQDIVSKSMGDLLKCSNFEERMLLAKKIADENGATLPRPPLVMKMFILGLYARLKSVDQYKPEFRVKSAVKLFKPVYVSIKVDSDTYGLEDICENPVDVDEIEGNHATILDNPKLAEEIMRFFVKDDEKLQSEEELNLTDEK